MSRRSFAVALVSILVALSALAAVSHGQSGEYKIGVLEPLTGPLAFEGKRHLEGYEVMRDIINENGGVMGKKLVFAVGDATDPTAAASEAAPVGSTASPVTRTSFLPITPPKRLLMRSRMIS